MQFSLFNYYINVIFLSQSLFQKNTVKIKNNIVHLVIKSSIFWRRNKSLQKACSVQPQKFCKEWNPISTKNNLIMKMVAKQKTKMEENTVKIEFNQPITIVQTYAVLGISKKRRDRKQVTGIKKTAQQGSIKIQNYCQDRKKTRM